MKKDMLEQRWQYVKAYPHNHCFNYIRGNASTPEAALAQYDFVFVAERMDECEYGPGWVGRPTSNWYLVQCALKFVFLHMITVPCSLLHALQLWWRS